MATATSHRPPGPSPQAPGFIGREAELAQVRGLLRRSRLVTVTGPAGVGKTRLALRTAEKLAGRPEPADRFGDGVHFIELSTVRDPGLLAGALAGRLTDTGHTDAGLSGTELSGTGLSGTEPGGAGDGAGSPLSRLLGFLRDRRLLLLLDTCEHLVDGCAALADTILREAPGVVILATSRQPLDAAGEAVFQLRPLPVPAPDAAAASRADAVELFAQRAAAAVPGFTVTPDNLRDVITVCRRLDGLPLAIELAAVRLRALPLHQLAARGDDRPGLLTGGRRSGTPRHQTLRAAIEWSYSLCTPAEQLLWARLSVFAAGFGITAAEETCAGGELAADAVLPAIIGLVDKNVLMPGDGTSQAGGTASARPTFRMLNTLREFGAERLHGADQPKADQPAASPPAAGPPAAGPRTSGLVPARLPPPRRVRREPEPDRDGQAEAAVRRRFVAHYLALAEQSGSEPAAGQAARYQRLRREHANLRAAFDYALSLPGNDGAAIVLATSLLVYWQLSGLLREGEYWLDQALERCPRRSAARARVLAARGYLRVLLGDFPRGRADAGTAVTLAAAFGDMTAGGRGYSALHRALAFSGNPGGAQDAASSATACLSAAGDSLGLAQLDVVDAMLRLQAGEPGQCRESAARGLARLPAGELWCTASLHTMDALGLFLQGGIQDAKLPAGHALEMKHQLGDVPGTALALGTLAFIAAGEGRYERTAWLLGASAPLWERTGPWYSGSPAFESLHQVAERVARTGLGDDRFWRLRAAGAAAPATRAVTLALSDIDQFGEPG